MKQIALSFITPRSLKVFIGIYFFFIVFLFFYSFTQIDLGLTMTRASFATSIQRGFQYIGYFNRPLSTFIYSTLLIGLFTCYGVFIYSAKKKLLTVRALWKIIVITSIILAFAYNAFSYDIFNYIFDAKIFTHYDLNPYSYKALDFPKDPMLSFMHWTQRSYPYGPVWLGITVPLSYLGLNFFLPTFFLFKLLAVIAYLGTVGAIYRIMRKISPEHEVLAMVFFALNPLVIIESLISGHNDIVMMFLCMVSVLFLIKRRYVLAFLLLFLSIGIKYATGFLLPLYIIIFLFERKKVSITWQQIFPVFILAMLFAVVAAALRTTFQPWYLLLVLPLAALVANRQYVLIPAVVLTIAALLNYIPFLYSGNWDNPIPFIIQMINISGILVSVVLVLIYHLRLQRKQLKKL